MRNFGAKAWIYRQYNYRNCRRQSRVMFGTQTYKERCKSHEQSHRRIERFLRPDQRDGPRSDGANPVNTAKPCALSRPGRWALR